MKLVSVTEISSIGKGALGLIVTLGGLLQIPAVGNPIMAFAKLHPHISGIIGAVTVITAFLSNPQVQKAFNISLPANAKIDATIKT